MVLFSIAGMTVMGLASIASAFYFLSSGEGGNVFFGSLVLCLLFGILNGVWQLLEKQKGK